MSKLQLYMKAKNLTAGALAEQVGVSASTITRAISGKRPASFDLAIAIEKATDGEVLAEQFSMDCFLAQKSVRLSNTTEAAE